MTVLLPAQRTRLLSMLKDDSTQQQAMELIEILGLPWEERAALCRHLIDADRWWAAMLCATPDDHDLAARRLRTLALRSAHRWEIARLPALTAPLEVLEQATTHPVPPEHLAEAREQALGQRAGRDGAELAAVMAVARGCDADLQRASQTLTEFRFEERRKQRQWACALLGLPWLPLAEDALDALRPRLLEGDPEAVALISADRERVSGHFAAEGEWVLAMRCFPDSDTLLYALADTCAYEVLPYAPRILNKMPWKEALIQAMAKGDRDEIRHVVWGLKWVERHYPHGQLPPHGQRAMMVIQSLCKRTPLLAATEAARAMVFMVDGEEWLRRIVLGMLSLR